MRRQLVLIGGGHAHMLTLAHLDTFIAKGHEVTVIQPSPHHYYSGMGPGLLGGTYTPNQIRFATRRLVEAKGGRFILGAAQRIDAAQRVVYLEGQEQPIPYDILSCNAGSSVPRELIHGPADNIFTAKPIEHLLLAQQRILDSAARARITIAVIGSGPSALEIAGNIHQLCRRKGLIMPRIQLFAGRRLLFGRSARIRALARRILEGKGIEILEFGHVQRIENGRLVLENSEEYRADLFFPAIGVKPSPIFARSGLAVGPDGGLRVNACLQSVEQAAIFGGGDCIHFDPQPLDKVGVYAVRQNPVLLHNLLAALDNRPLQTFAPGGAYLLIYNLGGGIGIFSKWGWTFAGRLAFRLKDAIDRRFMKTFQRYE